MTIIPALERRRQEDQQFNIMLSWALSSKLVQATGDLISKEKKVNYSEMIMWCIFFPSHHPEMIRWCNCFSVTTMPPWEDLAMHLFSSCPEGQRRDNRIRKQQLGRHGGHLGVLRHSLPYWTKSDVTHCGRNAAWESHREQWLEQSRTPGKCSSFWFSCTQRKCRINEDHSTERIGGVWIDNWLIIFYQT